MDPAGRRRRGMVPRHRRSHGVVDGLVRMAASLPELAHLVAVDLARRLGSKEEEPDGGDHHGGEDHAAHQSFPKLGAPLSFCRGLALQPLFLQPLPSLLVGICLLYTSTSPT